MAEEWARLTREDVPGFDKTMTELVLEMGEYGWVGRVSAKGHAIMRAPDGTSTHSVSRDSLRGRSGRNSRAVFERWKREHLDQHGEESLPKHECKQCGEKFDAARALGAHRKKHIEPVPCPICGKPVKYLVRHMAVHEKKTEKRLSEKLIELAVQAEMLEKQLEGE